ncbi:hypothetical protein TCSYLVIO_005601 [Trypanosoma cruzi]|nr:hypothetical protein TCSYLVIO_005601 [Trypanosoma cruzi]
MSHGHGTSLEATADEILRSISVEPDCQIKAYPNGTEAGIAQKLPFDARIVEVDGQAVTDRGELREILLSGDASRQVSLVYEKTNEPSERVKIEESVRCDGCVSGVAQQPLLETVLNKIADEDLSLPVSQQTPVQSSLSKLSSQTAFLLDTGSCASQSAAMKDGEEDKTSVASSDLTAETTGSAPCHSVGTGYLNKVNSVPELLEFEKIDTPARTEDSFPVNLRRPSENSMRRRLMRAVEMVAVGRCIVCVCYDVNPIAEIELVAKTLNMHIVTIDLGVKLRLRPKAEVFVEQFKAAMYEGAWFVLVNAHKSIASCRILEELLKESESRNFQGFSSNARVIICLEPHPHFPRFLLKEAEITRIQSCLSASVSELSMATSMSCNRLVTAESWYSRRTSGWGVPTTSGTVVGTTGDKPRVRINASVDVVDIAPREVVSAPRERPLNIHGAVVLRSAFTGVPGDKFLCVVSDAVEGRFAVGSSMGNVYFVDELGNSLMQAHTHEAAIWDISFKERYQFATGCEDGNAVEWSFEMGGIDGAALSPTSSTSLGNDVYCVSYVHGQTVPPLLIGGLSRSIVLCSNDRPAQHLTISSNAQVMDCIPTGSVVLVGGSDGSITVVDVASESIVTSFKGHSRKLPALTVRDNNQFFTGSFDSTILSWDYRLPYRPTGKPIIDGLPSANFTHTLQLKDYVTGLHVDDVHLAASVGENLYLWDVRKLTEVLGGFPQAWKGLSRGVWVNSTSRCVVTASQDGYVRFWTFV